MKRTITYLLLFGILIHFYSCDSEAKSKNAVKNSAVSIDNKEAQQFKKELESLNDSTSVQVILPDSIPIIYANEDEILNLQNGVVLFGWPKCPWFRNAVEPLIEFANEDHVRIYYLNIHDIRDFKELEDGKVITTKKGSAGYQALLDKFKDIWNPYTAVGVDSIKRISSPTVLYIEKGKGVSKVVSTVVSQTDPKVKLDSTQREELKARYRRYFTS
ncbi:hypothetical protein ACFSQ3_07295 [Sphingobacterium corticis]|uniref:Thioredoxin domain-containing protein n=1 Tax=Sphingobacterium corticis TaxID=1812823 RepID=A0ABW5NJH4_9SPHI